MTRYTYKDQPSEDHLPGITGLGIDPNRDHEPMPMFEVVETEHDPSEFTAPCPKCNGLRKWWNFAGKEFCMKCEPPVTACRLLVKKKKIFESKRG